MEKMLTLLEQAGNLGWEQSIDDSYVIDVFCLAPYESAEEAGMTYLCNRLNIWLQDNFSIAITASPASPNEYRFVANSWNMPYYINAGTTRHKYPHQAINEGVCVAISFLLTLKANNQL